MAWPHGLLKHERRTTYVFSCFTSTWIRITRPEYLLTCPSIISLGDFLQQQPQRWTGQKTKASLLAQEKHKPIITSCSKLTTAELFSFDSNIFSYKTPKHYVFLGSDMRWWHAVPIQQQQLRPLNCQSTATGMTACFAHNSVHSAKPRHICPSINMPLHWPQKLLICT